jgi:uncharacterized membrane protein
VLILVPVVVLAVILAKAVGAMRALSEPITQVLPVKTVFGFALIDLIAIFILVMACFVAGLAAERTLIRSRISKLESAVLMNVPGYVLVKGVLSGLEEDDTDRLYPVLVTFDDGARIGLEIERLQNGQVVVMTPSSPNPWSGEVHIMEAGRIRRLDVPMRDYVQNVQRFGRGMGELLSSVSDTSV